MSLYNKNHEYWYHKKQKLINTPLAHIIHFIIAAETTAVFYDVSPCSFAGITFQKNNLAPYSGQKSMLSKLKVVLLYGRKTKYQGHEQWH